jgi:glycosyltransferase involved in cell wall biosynthesis
MAQSTPAPYVHALPRLAGERRVEQVWRKLTGYNDYFFPSTRMLGKRAWIADADLWHFHNLHGHYISIPSLAAESRRRKIILSPVDQFVSTGYCPYTLGCERFRDHCGLCPQIDLPYPGISRDTTPQLLAMKRKAVGESGFHFLVHTRYLADHYASTFVGTRPINQLYYGIDIQVFRPMDRAACAESLGLPPPRRFVVGLLHSFVGERRKGIMQLLSGLRDVADGRFEVLVVGNASEKAREFKTPNMPVMTLPFIKDEAQLAMAFNLCDALLYPTQADNLSLTCLNALACGVPVISSRVGGHPEAIEDFVNGFLCEPGRDDQIINRAAQMAADPELHARLAAGARQTAVEKFDTKNYVKNLLHYYEQVLQRD